MKASQRRIFGKGALELIEEAIHLLRLAPGATLACYYTGTLPFVLAALFFWADMSRSPFAAQHLSGAALGLALLFIWMKFWQTVFASRLRAQISSTEPPHWGWRRCARVLLIQSALQPSSALFLTLSAAAVVPFFWTFGFYQNATALGDGEKPQVGEVLKKSWRLCTIWPGQNFTVLLLLAAFGFFVFVDVATVAMMLPQMAKTLLGVDSVYAHSMSSMLNTTFFATVFGITWLCMDPIIKAVYVFRCFYGQAITTGEDLKSELKQYLPGRKFAVALGVVMVCLTLTQGARAADSGPASTTPAASPGASPGAPAPQLDHAIDDVIHQAKYTWRMPRDSVPDEEAGNGVLERFFDRAGEMFDNAAKATLKWLGRLLLRFLPTRSLPSGPSSIDWGAAVENLLILLAVVVVCGLVWLLFMAWQRSTRVPAPVSSEAIPAAPDLRNENVGADQLPEDGWVKVGRELLERGEYRLALRAFYFASLAHLAARGLITVAKFKSNRDYERELRRRGHSLPQVLSTFSDNVAVFDRSWYGMHEVTRELAGQFIANVERIKSVG